MHTEVTPNTKERFGNDLRLCQVLGAARLWSAFDDEASLLLPQDDVARIRHSFQGDIEGNPVTKTPLEIMRVGGRLQIVDVSLERQQQQQEPTGGQNAAQMLRGADNATLLACMQCMEASHNQQPHAMRAEQLAHRQWSKQQFDLLIANQQRFGGTTPQALSRQDPQQQQRRHTGAHQQQQLERTVNPRAALEPTRNVDRNAVLHPRMQTLAGMWEEFQFGIGDNKPAKSFSLAEKNHRKHKQMHYRRSKIWKLQCHLTNAGYSVHEANARMSDVYNSTKITSIIMQIIRDQKNQSYNFVGSQRIHPWLHVNPN